MLNGDVRKRGIKGGDASDVMAPMSVDDAMLQTGFGLFNIYHMLLAGMILLGVLMQALMLGYVLPAAQCDLNLSVKQQGLLAAIPYLAMILTSYFWGYLGDTRGRKPVIFYSMIASVIASLLTSFAPEMYSFAVLQFITGVCTSGPTAIVYTFLGEFNNLRHRDKMVAFGSLFVGLSTVVLPAISWLILPLDFSYPIDFLGISYRSWRLLVVVVAFPYIIAAVCLFFTPESPKFLYAMGKNEECMDVLRKIYAVNTFKSADSFPVKSLISENPDLKVSGSEKKVSLLTSMKDQTLPLFKMPLVPWTALILFVQFGLFATTNGFFVWFPTILNSLAGHEGDASICTILEAVKLPVDNGTTIIECDDTINISIFERSIYVGLIFSSTYLIVGVLVDFVGKKILLVVILVITGACGIGAHLAPNQQLGVILFAIFQMSGACVGLINAVAVEIVPTKFRAMAICLAMMMGRAGSMVGTNVLGLLLHTHCGVSFYLFGGLIIANGLICLCLPGKKANIKQTKDDPDKQTKDDSKQNTIETESPQQEVRKPEVIDNV